MKLKLVALSQEAFIDGCMEAILQHDVSHTHVLARDGEQFLYFITAEQCTFNTVIMNKKHQPLQIECTLDPEGVSVFHEESDDPERIRESFISYVAMMKVIPTV